jgi:hypothetical protein
MTEKSSALAPEPLPPERSTGPVFHLHLEENNLMPVKSSLVVAFLCLVLLVGSALASPTELLYLLEGKQSLPTA